MHGIALLAFTTGLFVLVMAVMTGTLNTMAKRRQVVESFEVLFLNLLTFGLLGIAAICFMISFSLAN